MERFELLKQFKQDKENLLNILHALQNHNQQNYLSPDDLKEAANYLNITFSHIYGVATYYSMFSVKPRGKYIIRICNSPVCNMESSYVIVDEIKKMLSVEIGGTTSDKLFTLELSECLGQCDSAPGMMINEDVYGNLEAENLKSIFAKYK